MAAAVAELTGTVQKIVFQKDGFVIAALRDGPAVKGDTGTDGLKTGLEYRFRGKAVQHPEYGEQFLFTSYALEEPHGQDGVMAYLSKVADGVGIMTAGKLWDAFGPDAVRVLMDEPARAVAAGCCTERVAQKASASLREKTASQKTQIDLMGIFSGLGFPGSLIPKLIEKWGVAAPQVVREDPFRLLLEEMPGCGFKRVDHLHHHLGHPHTAPRRQMACAWNKVHANNDGHTWLKEEDVEMAVAAEIGGDSDPAYAVQQAVDAGLLRRHSAGGTSWLAVPRKADAEGVIARSLARLLAAPAELWPDAASLPHLSEHQKAVLGAVLTRPVAVLTGTPGTGKTFAAAQVIKAVQHLVPPDEIAVCAPTGKAAVRITKAMNEYGLKIEATTVHRLLKIAGQTRDGFTFQHNQDNPLPCRVVVLDEGSMMDADLEAALLDALEPGTHLLVVGDPYQLPPVGHGAPLRDLIDSGVLPPGELTEIRRNSGQIVAACQDIKNGFRYVTCDAYDDQGNNFRSLEAADADAVLANVRAACKRLKAKAEAGELAPGFDPIEDVQVLCVVNEKSPLGRFALNRILQEELNPASGPGQGGDTHPFRTGDKVICLVNGKMANMQKTPGEPDSAFDAWYKSAMGPPEKYIANGDMGRVLAASPQKLIVRFSHPERTVQVNIPAGGKKKGPDAAEGEEGLSWGPIDLGYAVTAHKSQGSEWPFVIIPIDESDRAKRVVSRELLYTAISRAKWRCLLVGRRAVADEWCQTVVMRRRKTLLKERIVAAVAKMQAQAGQGGGK